MNLFRNIRSRQGFTLLELMIVVVIVGMLAIKPHEAILDQIFVLTSEQSSGVGLSLLEMAKRSMPQGFTLRMAATNCRAARFYELAGLRFVQKGSHPISGAPVHYYRWDGS